MTLPHEHDLLRVGERFRFVGFKTIWEVLRIVERGWIAGQYLPGSPSHHGHKHLLGLSQIDSVIKIMTSYPHHEMLAKIAEPKSEPRRGRRRCSSGTCQDCGWDGPLSRCDRYEEQESWEMPHIRYWVFVCPKCGSESVEPYEDLFPNEWAFERIRWYWCLRGSVRKHVNRLIRKTNRKRK